MEKQKQKTSEQMVHLSSPVERSMKDDFEIPDFAIERLARFFLPLIQESMSENESAHLSSTHETDKLSGKGVES